MDVTASVFDQSFLNLVVRWMILTAMFLALTYFFRDRTMPEGALGFALSLFLLLPANVLLGAYLGSMPDLPETVEMPAYLAAAFTVNLITLETFIYVLPGFAVSSQLALILFNVGLTVASVAIRYIPDVAEMVPPGVFQ